MAGKKRVRRSPSQIVEKLQEADRLLNAGQSVGQVLQALEVSEAWGLVRDRMNREGAKSAKDANR